MYLYIVLFSKITRAFTVSYIQQKKEGRMSRFRVSTHAHTHTRTLVYMKNVDLRDRFFYRNLGS